MEEQVKRMQSFLFGAMDIQQEEEIKMKKEFNFKESAGQVWDVVKEGASRVGRFIKKHAAKSLLGLGALTVGGLVTGGLGGAMIAGTLVYASVAAAMKVIAAKRKKAEIDRKELALSVLGEGALYTTLGGMSLLCLFGVGVGILGSLFAYSYVGFAYLSYFIVA